MLIIPSNVCGHFSAVPTKPELGEVKLKVLSPEKSVISTE